MYGYIAYICFNDGLTKHKVNQNKQMFDLLLIHGKTKSTIYRSDEKAIQVIGFLL